ncbi:MAG TPA: glycosyltransferase family 39 protein [Verrucomicrobiae bacterium]|nr:glycosyltransferase family 39 protein [Verrucomicrobiae bacterium]
MTPPPRSSSFQRHWPRWVMLAVLVFVAALRLQMMNFPLERDEGEYAYAGQLLLQGIPPYELAYNMKFPGTYLAYAAIMAPFGETPAGIHFGLLLLTTATALMVFWLGKKMLDETAGVVAATSYATLAISTGMLGYSAHATHFCAFFATLGLCCLWSGWSHKKLSILAAAGFCFGLAILMKQHAALLALWAGIVLTVTAFIKNETSRARRLAAVAGFAVSVILPFGLCCLWLWHAGVFEKFWFWTIQYGQAYVSLTQPGEALGHLNWSLRAIVSDCYLWWLAVLGLVVIWFDSRLRSLRIGFLGLCLASALTTAPGFYFRTHYFLLLLPAAALLAGCAISGGAHWLRQRPRAAKFAKIPAVIFALLLIFTLYTYTGVASVLTRFGGHALYGMEPVPESQAVAAFIRANSKPDARIAVLGSEPQIYFYSRRHSATGYIYIYGLMEPQPFALKMQHEMMAEIQTNQPEYIIYSNVDSSWQRRADSDPTIFNWWANYKTGYELVGIAELNSLLETTYLWNEDAAHHGPLKNVGLEIYRRKPATPAN